MPPPRRDFYNELSSNATDGLRLSEVTSLIANTIDSSFTRPIWVIAEISQMNVNKFSGHCYLDLVEKSNEKVIASIRATIWSFQYQRISQTFFKETGKEIEQGMQLLMMCYVKYSSIYGLSLNIVGVSSEFTLGYLSKQREITIRKLKENGVWELNKSIPLTLVIRKIAVISSATAAGWEDFQKQLLNNSHGIKFFSKLFPAIMQGQQTTQSIISALDNIISDDIDYDAVVIIRGGGSKLDLHAFDDYILCDHIAQFPIPIITGIGHERDLSVADMVANTYQKTPTAVATYIIDQNNMVLDYVSSASDRLSKIVQSSIDSLLLSLKNVSVRYSNTLRNAIKQDKQKLQAYSYSLSKTSYSITPKINNKVLLFKQELLSAIEKRMTKEKNSLQLFEDKNNILSPKQTLKRGYSIVLDKKGKSISNIEQFTKGDKIKIIVQNGSAITVVNEIINNDKLTYE